VANRLKPSGIVSKESIIRVHLIPVLGSKKLDAITNEHVQRLKRQLVDHAAKTANNVLTVLNVMLKKAVEWDLIERMPCTVRLLPIPKPSAGFYDFDEYERMVAAARDGTAVLIVLLGGEAGLRCGEMIGLQWDDVDLIKRQLRVERSEWRGHIGVPKGGRIRHVPLTIRLAIALRQYAADAQRSSASVEIFWRRQEARELTDYARTRYLVDQNSASWNRVAAWLGRIERIFKAA
jgi:integrase